MTYIPSKKVKYVYQNTPSGSQLRKLVVDWSVHLGALSGGGCFQENCGDYPKDYLIDVVIAQYALAPSGKPKFTDFRIIRPNYQDTLPVTTKTTAEKKDVSFPCTSTFVSCCLQDSDSNATIRRIKELPCWLTATVIRYLSQSI